MKNAISWFSFFLLPLFVFSITYIETNTSCSFTLHCKTSISLLKCVCGRCRTECYMVLRRWCTQSWSMSRLNVTEYTFTFFCLLSNLCLYYCSVILRQHFAGFQPLNGYIPAAENMFQICLSECIYNCKNLFSCLLNDFHTTIFALSEIRINK